MIGNLASRGPWDHDHKPNAPTFTTRGNNAKSATSWTNADAPSAPQYMPASSDAGLQLPVDERLEHDRDCRPDGPAPGASWDDSAAMMNLFVAHNRMHDFAYFLGFTEQNWNAQDYNFGLTETRQQNDPVIGDVQSGARSTTHA